MKNRMFVVPGSFVPYNDTVTLLTYKRLRNVDMDMDVFCFKGKTDESLLSELEKDQNFSRFHIKHTSDLDWAVPRNHPFRLPAGLFLMNKYVRDALKEFEKSSYTHLFTSIVPGISHIVGYKIKKKHPEVYWIASFSDPFKGSPYKNADLKDRSLFYRIAYHVGAFCLYNNRYEEVAVRNADRLVFICQEQRDFTLKQYPDYEELVKKSVIYPLTYIPEWKMYRNLLENSRKEQHTVKQAVHLGRLYGLRKIDTFLDALKEINDETDLSDKIVFHQYSEIQSPDVKKIKEYGLEKVFVLHDSVSYQKSTEIMKDADILVLFDTLLPKEEIQPYLPSKIVEYLMLKKPILAVCDQNSPSYRILKEYGYDTLGSEKEVVKENILKLIQDDKTVDYPLDRLNNDNYDKLIVVHNEE